MKLSPPCVLLILAFLPLELFAGVGFFEILPNPSGDDTLGEYIDIRNTGCEEVDISGYEIRDLQRNYILPSGYLLASHTNRRILYSESRIQLNNSGHEELTLSDISRSIIDRISYDGNQGDDVRVNFNLTDNDCTPPPEEPPTTESGSTSGSGSEGLPDPGESTGGTSGTGEISGTGGLSGSGTISEPGNGTGSTDPGSGTGGGSGSGSIEIPSGTGSDTGSGAGMPGSGSTGSGNESTGGTLPTLPIEFLPLSMEYDDTDNNNKVDTLYIFYSLNLTGTFDAGSVAIFSKTGGLSSTKIDTATGYIVNGILSGNILILTLREQDLEKVDLNITNTTSSDLRLKTIRLMGIYSFDGRESPDFLLTSSFENYKKVSRKSYTLTSGATTSTGSETDSGSISSSGSNNGIFPEIFLTLQSPTNATLSGEIFTCTTTSCRINITIAPIFSSGFAMKDFLCNFGTGEILAPDSDCNPNTFYFSSTGVLMIELVSKGDQTQKKRKEFPIAWNVTPSSSSSLPNPQNANIPDTGKPVPILELDSKWKEYYFQNGDNDLICYAFTCSINFTGEKSYDPEGSEIRFLWIYGPNEISTSKDPGTRKLSLGDHGIILRVIDSAGNFDQIVYKIRVVGPKTKAEKEKIEKPAKFQKKKESSPPSVKEKKKKPKKIKMIFYTSPEIILQGKSTEEISAGKYLCHYKKTALCSVNFTLSGVLRGYEYAWEIDGEEVHRGKNPSAWKLLPGEHTIRIISYEKGATLPREIMSYTIIVKKEISKKKAKKIKIPKIVLPKISLPEAHAENMKGGNDATKKDSFPYGVFLFLSGSLMMYFLHRRNRF